MICPNCQSELPEGSKFCLNCGAKLDGAAENSTAAEARETAFVKLPTLEKLLGGSAPGPQEAAAPEEDQQPGPEPETETEAAEPERESAPEEETPAAEEEKPEKAQHQDIPPELAGIDEDQRFKSLGPSYDPVPEEPLNALQNKNKRMLILLIVCSFVLAAAIFLVGYFLVPGGADPSLAPADIADSWSIRFDIKNVDQSGVETKTVITGMAQISYDDGDYVLISIMPVEVIKDGAAVSEEELLEVVADCQPVYGLLKDGVLYFNSPLDAVQGQLAVPMGSRGGSASFTLANAGRLDFRISK